ncbi:MAG: YraN family protein [Treponema sp.]|jgi:putative endonuclease|nr:YraN family protein [Treponema sp.]
MKKTAGDPQLSSSGAGRAGEDRAAAALEEAGLCIIARNVRSPCGEVDIVAREGETIIFVEVKTWSRYGIEELQYAVNPKKQRRIIETAKYFLAAHREYNGMAVRFDVVFVGKEGITHLVSAFMECI